MPPFDARAAALQALTLRDRAKQQAQQSPQAQQNRAGFANMAQQSMNSYQRQKEGGGIGAPVAAPAAANMAAESAGRMQPQPMQPQPMQPQAPAMGGVAPAGMVQNLAARNSDRLASFGQQSQMVSAAPKQALSSIGGGAAQAQNVASMNASRAGLGAPAAGVCPTCGRSR